MILLEVENVSIYKIMYNDVYYIRECLVNHINKEFSWYQIINNNYFLIVDENLINSLESEFNKLLN